MTSRRGPGIVYNHFNNLCRKGTTQRISYILTLLKRQLIIFSKDIIIFNLFDVMRLLHAKSTNLNNNPRIRLP